MIRIDSDIQCKVFMMTMNYRGELRWGLLV